MPAETLNGAAHAEFRLVAACCRWPPGAARDDAVRQAAAAVTDWDKFLRIAKRQHVEGLVWRGLRAVDIAIPAPVRDRLVKVAARITRQNLMAAAESGRIQKAFDDENLPVVFLKGAAIGVAAYGDIGVKFSWDIDIVVEPQTVARATAVLATLGYAPLHPLPDTTSASYRHWIKYGHEYIFRNGDKNTHVELHWRLVNNKAMLTGLSPARDTQRVTIAGGIELATFADDLHLIYLCVHGARHNWGRLKWIVDVNALFARLDEAALRRLLDQARHHNADLAVAQAVTLCDALFDLEPAANLARELLRRRRQRWLMRLALRYLAAGDGEHEIQWDRFGQLVLYLSRYVLAHGIRYRLSELKMQLFAPFELLSDGAAVADTPLYPVYRIAVWLARLGRQRHVPALHRPVEMS